MTTGKTIALTRWTFVGKVMSPLFNMLYKIWKIHWRRDRLPTPVFLGFPCGSAGNKSACNVGDLGSIPGSGRSPGGGHGNPLPYSCLENPKDRRVWWATVHRFAKSWTQLNQDLLHYRQFLYQQSYQGSRTESIQILTTAAEGQVTAD